MRSTRPNSYQKGDVVLAVFPNSDQQTSKPRPVVIVQADNLVTGIDQVVVAMISSRIFRAGHPSRVTILKNSPEGRAAGVFYDSVVMTDSIATIKDVAISHLIGSLPMPPIEAALRHTFGLA